MNLKKESMNKKRVYVWGTGVGANELFGYINKDKCYVLGFIDNNKMLQGEKFNGIDVFSLDKITDTYDYIIVATKRRDTTKAILSQLKEANVEEEKIIPFFSMEMTDFKADYSDFIDENRWKQLIGVKNQRKNIYIWGTGVGADEIMGYLFTEKCNILGIIDNSKVRQGQKFKGINVISFDEIGEKFDYIVIATKRLETTRSILLQLEEAHIDFDKIIPFYDNEKLRIRNEYAEFVNINLWNTALITREINNYKRAFDMYIRNIKYEIIGAIQDNSVKLPIIAPYEETLRMIIEEGCSIARFGDGELGLIDKQRFHKFQKDDNKLAERLDEVLHSKEDKCLIAIADNYGSLDKMTELGAESVRAYMTSGARDVQMSLLDLDRKYHNAYITRPYVYFKDKEHAGERFEALKRIWQDRDVVIIEGEETRLGIKNDILDNAKSIRRIIGPKVNAFDKYELILNEAKDIEKDALFLIALGPTATVLAYDLYKAGYQAIDIGHIDVEYEWFKMGVDRPVKLEGKYVCEAPGGDEVEIINDIDYENQIIALIR